MDTVAVAGGTGNLGRAIVEILNTNSRHRVFILSRKAAEKMGDSDVPVSTQILTVLSCLSIMDEAAGKAQINLIKAAAQSVVTEGFAPSEWGARYPPEAVQYLPHLKFRVEAIEGLKQTGLRWTRFLTGYFLDFYGLPHIKSYLQPVAFVLDISNKTAGIPATGNEHVAFTYTFDVAKFVAASLDLSEWPEESVVIGDKIAWNEFIRLAEAAVGYDDLEKLNKFQVTELPSHLLSYPSFPKQKLQYVFAISGQWVAAGYFNLPSENSLNAKFPSIETLTVREMLDQTWKGK